jgi:hypothetical protein
VKDSDVERSRVSVRAVGILALLGSMVLTVVFVYLPYRDMLAGAPSVSVSLMGVVLIPLSFGLGVAYGIVGEPATRLLGHRHQPTAARWIMSVTLLGLGGWLYWWLNQQLVLHGYS